MSRLKKWAPKRKMSKKCPFIYADHLHLFAWSHDLYLCVFLHIFKQKTHKHKCMTMQISANVLLVKQEPYFYSFLSNFPPPPYCKYDQAISRSGQHYQFPIGIFQSNSRLVSKLYLSKQVFFFPDQFFKLYLSK